MDIGVDFRIGVESPWLDEGVTLRSETSIPNATGNEFWSLECGDVAQTEEIHLGLWAAQGSQQVE